MNAFILAAVLANPVGPAPLPIHYALDPAEYLLVELSAGRGVKPPPISPIALSIHYAARADEYLIAELTLNRIGRIPQAWKPRAVELSPWRVKLDGDFNEATRLAADLFAARGELADLELKAVESHPEIAIRRGELERLEAKLSDLKDSGVKVDRKVVHQASDAAIEKVVNAARRSERGITSQHPLREYYRQAAAIAERSAVAR